MRNWLPKRSLVAASVVCVLAGSTAWAQQQTSQAVPPGDLEAIKRMVQEVISQNEDLRRRVRELEAGRTRQQPATTPVTNHTAPVSNQVSSQTQTAQRPPTDPAKEPARAPLPDWVEKLRRLEVLYFGGAVEVEARNQRNKNFTGRGESLFELKTAEFDLEAKLTEWAVAEIAVEWTGGAIDDPDQKLTVNESFLTFEGDFPFSMKLGRAVVPFGVSVGSTVAARFEQQLTLTDPLPVAMFDAKEDHILLNFKIGGLKAGAYVFTGSTQRGRETRLEHYGATIGYGMQADPLTVTAGLSMIDSVFDTDGLTEKFPEALRSRPVPGLAGYVRLGLFDFSLVTAYYAAAREMTFLRDDERFRIRPEAWYVELGYMRDIFRYKMFGALSYSESKDAANLAPGQLASQDTPGFPKRRAIATVGAFILPKLRLTFDYSHDEDYPKLVGSTRLSGTGTTAATHILRMTYEW